MNKKCLNCLIEINFGIKSRKFCSVTCQKKFYYKNNREKIEISNKKWVDKNKIKRKLYIKKYHENNKRK